VSEDYSTSSYQIVHQSDNKSLSYSQKTIFNMTFCIERQKIPTRWLLFTPKP